MCCIFDEQYVGYDDYALGSWQLEKMRANANQLIEEFKQLLQQLQMKAAMWALPLLLLHLTVAIAGCCKNSIYGCAGCVAGTGAYTGEVSAELLKELISYWSGILNAVIFLATNFEGETPKCIKCGFDCHLGESLDQRENGQAEQVVLLVILHL